MSLPKSRVGLLGLALAIGALIVIVGNAATDLILGRVPLADGTLGSIDAPDVAIGHLVFASLPMIVLALAKSRSARLWSVAILPTLLFWAYFNWRIWQESLTGFAGGADIGLGLIMLASPFLVLLAVGFAALAGRTKAGGGGEKR